MGTISIVVICCLVGVIVLLTALLYFEKTVIKEVFSENHDLKLRLFNLIHEEELRHERIVNNRASFDEKCLYDLVRRVEIVEKKLSGVNGKPEVKKIDIINIKKDKENK